MPGTIDVAIIGAGYSGLCTALEVAWGGASVLVLEAGILGCGASTLNGGMLGPSFHKLGVIGLKKKFAAERANAIFGESIGFVDFLDEFLSREGIEADFVRTGRFRGALRPGHYDAMARELEVLQRAIGVEGTLIGKADLHLETGSPLFFGGVVYPRDARLHPGKYHDGLVARVRHAGISIATETAVTALQKTAHGFTLSTARGTVRATQVAVCTNGYTGMVTPDLRRRLLPIRSAMIAAEPIAPEVMKAIMPKGRVYSDNRHLIAYYRPSPDGTRVLFGGRATGRESDPIADAKMLWTAMSRVYPQIREAEISHSWSGLVAYAFDHVPHLGQFGGGKQDGLYYAMGYGDPGPD